MNKEQAKRLIRDVFEASFDKKKFVIFIRNLLNEYESASFSQAGAYIKEAFRDKISRFERLGKYLDPEGKRIDLLIVYLKKNSTLNARTTLRNFVAGYLRGDYGSTSIKNAALVAFVPPDDEGWRFSLVKIDYNFDENGKIIEEKSPARRWSFLVGKNEKSHTAQKQLVHLLENDKDNPTLEELEKAFSVEPVTKEFFEEYRKLFIRTVDELDKILKKDKKILEEFTKKSINTVDFTKKLLAQIVFLYFIQKKGWLGVPKNEKWGDGDKNFLRTLFERSKRESKNFFNDYLEPLFYDALNNDTRGTADPSYYPKFHSKIPFLNGGLFEPIGNYDWKNTDITLPDDLFSNNHKTKEGDIGDGILDIFDRFNFTVNEDEPLEKEVAVDPELLGKLYEKFNAITPENFYEYKKALESGKKNEEKKFNKKYGVFYTPREIVHYMCQQSLIYYLTEELKSQLSKEDIEKFILHGEKYLENEETVTSKGKETVTYEYKLPETVRIHAKEIDEKLKDVKIVDPAVGSGAFLVGMMTEIVKARQVLSAYIKDKNRSPYYFKLQCIENSLYGVDIDQGATEISKLRLWLSLVVEEESLEEIRPLPNLDYKIVRGDSLIGIKEDVLNSNLLSRLEQIKEKFFKEPNHEKKLGYKKQIEKLLDEITYGRKEFDFELYFSEVFHQKMGFDIVIANPPYVSTKGRDSSYKQILKNIYKFADDLYNHFYFKGIEILRERGILTFISSKTYWTIQTKKNLRDLLLRNRIIAIFDTGDPFEAMVDTAVIIVQKKQNSSNYKIDFKDGKKSLSEPQEYQVKVNAYRQSPNRVIFVPTSFNIKIVEKYGKVVRELMNKWWDKIKTSTYIGKNKEELEVYRKSLKPGDVTLLGLITEGGVGLQTGDNGRYLGVLEGTKYAKRVRETRPEKIALAVKIYDIKKLGFIKNKYDAELFLADLSEHEIRELFDSLKERYGRDIFGQGYLYRIVSPDEIADVDSLTDDEKINGILGDRTFVPYEKGDKEGNRWYAPTPYYIDWSRENVKKLQKDPKARWQGYQFYFREGFCWNLINGTRISNDLKFRLSPPSVNDVGGMKLISLGQIIPNYVIVTVCNSTLINRYTESFINFTVNFQINDVRQIPIVIPTDSQLAQFEEVFNKAYAVQKKRFEGDLTNKEADKRLDEIQKEVDEMVYELYGVNFGQ